MKPRRFKQNIVTFAILLVITLFSIAINGYFYGIETHGELLSFIKVNLDPSLFKNDIMIKFIPYYFTYFYWLMTPMSKIFGVEYAYFYVYILVIFFLNITIFYLTKFLFKKDVVPYIAVLLFIVDKPFFGTGIKPDYLVPRLFVIPFLVLAMYLFLKERYALSFALAGLSANFHFTHAHQLFLLMMLYFAIFYKKIGFKMIAKSVIAFLIFASPVIYFAVTSKGVPIIPPPFWFGMVKMVNSHHFDPLLWGINAWIRVLSFILVFLLSLRCISIKNQSHQKLVTLAAGTIILGFIATLSLYFFPLSTLLTVQWWRSSMFLGIIAMVYSSNYLFELYKKNMGYKIASVGLGMFLFLSNFKGVLLFVLLILALNSRKNQKIFYSLLAAFFLLLLLSIFSSIVSNIPNYIYVLKIGLVPSVLLPLSLGLMILFEHIKKHLKAYRQKVVFGAMLILILLTSTLAGTLLIRKNIPWPANTLYEHMMFSYVNEGKKIITTQSLFDLFVSPSKFIRHNVYIPNKLVNNDWRSVQFWARDNTNKDAMFITPPYLYSFRAFSDRPIVMEWVDVGFVNFNVELANQLWDRITDVCDSNLFGECKENTCIDLCKKNYNNFSEKDILMLAKKYSADYVVVEKQKKLNFKLAYENDGFRVYRVK